MSDTFLTLIIPDAHVALARTIAATLSEGGAGMWTTALAPTQDAPATHWISTGFVPAAWMHMVPVRTYAQDGDAWTLVSETPGDPAAVLYACAPALPPLVVAPADLAALFAAADVTEQDPATALARLGLVLVTDA